MAKPLNLAALTQLVGSLSKRHAVTTPKSGSDRLWTDGFRFCFTPLSGVLPTFPSRYWFAIGLPVVFSLAGWSPRIRTGFHVPRPTQVPSLHRPPCVYGSVTLCAAHFHELPLRLAVHHAKALQHRGALERHGLGSSPFARHYSGNRCFFLFLRVLRCFSSPRWPRCIHR